jgi:hypothetical protein
MPLRGPRGGNTIGPTDLKEEIPLQEEGVHGLGLRE